MAINPPETLLFQFVMVILLCYNIVELRDNEYDGYLANKGHVGRAARRSNIVRPVREEGDA